MQEEPTPELRSEGGEGLQRESVGRFPVVRAFRAEQQHPQGACSAKGQRAQEPEGGGCIHSGRKQTGLGDGLGDWR